MGKTISVKDAARTLRKSTETLRRWRLAGIGPPWTYEGGHPCYRSDLLHAGSYTASGYVKTFPEPANEILDLNRLSEVDMATFEKLRAKASAGTLGESDELFIVVDDPSGELDTSDPTTRKVLGTLAKMARGSR